MGHGVAGGGNALHKLLEVQDREALLQGFATMVPAVATRGELGAKPEPIGRLLAREAISYYGVSKDAIDLAAARARDIALTGQLRSTSPSFPPHAVGQKSFSANSLAPSHKPRCLL